MENILIVEDSKDVNILLSQFIREAGYSTKSLYNGLEVIKEIKENRYDIILLDIMLPYKSGDEILKEIRKFSDIPVIVISAKDIVGIKVDILRIGADDYITKPFDIDEVIARIETNIRRYKKTMQKSHKLIYKDIILDYESKVVEVSGKIISFTVTEYMILEVLMNNIGKVFSKPVLYESVWKSEYLGDEKTIKTHISNLRNKLREGNENEQYIETVWGLGYRLRKI
ncbi:response regulator transcription factor [Clostridium butyricum]|uniref:response regulator transcription factor n=1 Tax=Clostridium butyricum TaxID=1492 RepID=UPI0018AC792B|nr:response regulator transcription factor [Clostridium butyricum]MDB2156193.1 response regulator transcription factor [Clostridium butyricum]QUF85378.1 response regulator transcription factor [Clostridium butyricum]